MVSEKKKAYMKAYREANKEAIAEYNKAYKKDNKEAIAEKKKAYWEANREALVEKKRAYYEANKEVISEKNKAYNKANKEAIAERKKAYREANKEAIAEYNKAYKEANKEAIAEYNKSYKKTYYEANREALVEYYKAYYEANKEAAFERSAKRNALKRNAVPKFLRNCEEEKARLRSIYKLRQFLSDATGIIYHVDHMWPLSDGGPHWSGNLQVITAQENLSKYASVDVSIKATIKEGLKYVMQVYKERKERGEKE
jgi:tetratricopeptide (TPR) repeat protein